MTKKDERKLAVGLDMGFKVESDVTMEGAIRELALRKRKALNHGGEKQVAKQHALGRLTARERIEKLLDPGTFWEIGRLNLGENPEMADRTAADGRPCGYGLIQGRRVLVTADDVTVLGGSDGLIGCQRKHEQAHIYATEKGYPTIFLGDNLGGLRLPDGMGSLGMSRSAAMPLFLRKPRITPRVATIMGDCFGEPSWIASASDVVFAVKGTCMGAAGPRILKIAIGEEITPHDLAASEFRFRETGEIDALAENDMECLELVREFLSYMPAHHLEEPPVVLSDDPVSRRIDDVGKIVPDRLNRAYDMHRLIKRIVDNGKYFPLKSEFGKSLITCLGRIGGRTVGFIANNPLFEAGAPTVASCEKAAGFICLCDSFNIPLVFLIDVPGMFPGSAAEKQKLPGKIVNWLETEQLATVPKISITLRKAYGMGWNIMMSPGEGADFTVAWPIASISFVDPVIGIELVHGSKIAEAGDPRAEREKLRRLWSTETAPWKAAEQHYFEDIIDPRDTRKFIAEALDIARGKKGRLISEHKLQYWPTTF